MFTQTQKWTEGQLITVHYKGIYTATKTTIELPPATWTTPPNASTPFIIVFSLLLDWEQEQPTIVEMEMKMIIIWGNTVRQTVGF